jgi:hypothetical protein
MKFQFNVSKEYKHFMWGFELKFSGSGMGQLWFLVTALLTSLLCCVLCVTVLEIIVSTCSQG